MVGLIMLLYLNVGRNVGVTFHQLRLCNCAIRHIIATAAGGQHDAEETINTPASDVQRRGSVR